MTAPVFAVVNPAAGSGRGRALWPEVAERLRALGFAYEFEGTQGPRTAESFTRQALRAGAEMIVAVGGDGTLNEVANGFFLDGVPVRPDASLAMIPAGSSSDLARGLGIPMGVGAVQLLREGQIREIDVGRASYVQKGQPFTRYFLNQADLGIGARIAQRAVPFKALGGSLAFFLASVAALTDPRPWTGQIRLDDGPQENLEVLTTVVAVGPFTGGGMRIAPGARWDDGLFDIVAIGSMPVPELLAQFPRVYLGTHLSHPQVQHWQAREVTIETQDAPELELDGEVVGTGPVQFCLLPNALRMHLPLP